MRSVGQTSITVSSDDLRFNQAVRNPRRGEIINTQRSNATEATTLATIIVDRRRASRVPVTDGTTSMDMTLPTVLMAATVVNATINGSIYSRKRTGTPAASATVAS